jgi:hypothetical protein
MGESRLFFRLDHDPNGLDYTVEVLEPTANGELNGVRLVVAGGRDDCRKLAGRQLATYREIEVPAFESKDAVILVRE